MKDLKELNKEELFETNGGTENCPMKKDQSWTYYVGYVLGWLFD